MSESRASETQDAVRLARGGAPPLVRAENLVVRFPLGRRRVVHALEDVSFTLAAGETLGVVGESGSGKTTLGFTVLRRHDPVAGRVIFEGRDITELTGKGLRDLRRDMQVVFQDPYSSLNPRMKVRDIVREPLVVHREPASGSDVDAHVRDLLEMCGLPASAMAKYPSAFSGGERQRIAIARALALRPKLIVADEAVSALDVSIQAQIINLLGELQSEAGVSYLFISHNLAAVRHIAHRVMIMYAGKVMEHGPTESIFARPMNPYTQALLSAVPIADPKTERTRERIVLRGEVPNVLNPPTGCVFRMRCPLAVTSCEEEPPLMEQAPLRWTACWRAADVADLGGAHPAANGASTLAVRPNGGEPGYRSAR